MSSEETKYDLSLGIDDYDAEIEEVEAIDQSEDAEVDGGPDGMPSADQGFVPEKTAPSLPPRERISTLLQRMRPCRGMLLKVMKTCQKPTPVSEVNELIAELQKNNRSVFTAADLCALLERAGAIELVNEDGTPFERNQEPQEVVDAEDGTATVEPAEPKVAHWVSTADALEVAAEDKPLERLYALFESDALYLPVYKTILELCARDGGAKTLALNAAVNGNPLVQNPRYFATYFIDRLEKCDAVEWTGSWTTTEVGTMGLDTLLDVEDCDVPEGIDDVVESPFAAYDDFGPLEG